MNDDKILIEALRRLSVQTGSCPECPCFDPSGDFVCIEYLMSQAAAALKEYACNGGGI